MTNISNNAFTFKSNVKKFYEDLISYDNQDCLNYTSHLQNLVKAISKELEINLNYNNNEQPVCRFLNFCINKIPDKNDGFASSIKDLKGKLNWIVNDNYKNIFTDNFFQNESFVEIIGPSGLLISPKIRIGLLLLGEEVFYPSHKHAAIEFYTILSGTSEWQINNMSFEKKAPGDNIFHDKWVPHAMKTNGEPVLALFSWSGDIGKEAEPI